MPRLTHFAPPRAERGPAPAVSGLFLPLDRAVSPTRTAHLHRVRPRAGLIGSRFMEITRVGMQPSRKGAPEWFTGNVRIDSMFQRADPARVGGAIVTFEPGARTAW